MGCCGGREKGPPEHTQKWEYITLSDFKSTSAWNGVAYAWLWIMAFIAVAVYAVDTMTAVNLLAFDRWSSQIKPAVPLNYSKWIFAGCILLSWALCFYEWARALRVIKRGGVAECYMDPLAVTLQSMRGSGWRRFLVFSELTKSKKGADYVALFVYFSFKGAVRIILAEGPRQAINAMSLYAVMNADLVPHGTTKVSNFEQFWINLGDMTNNNKMQAIIFFSMLFTLVIWVISALSLIIAALLYLFFLWHYIPQADGRLSVYCRRKIDRRLEKIVERKIIAANVEEERNRVKYAQKIEALKMKTGDATPLAEPKLIRAPTLPQISDSPDMKQQQEEPKMGIVRQNTGASVATLPPYSSRPPTRTGYGESAGPRPDMPTRAPTQSSMVSYASNAPLLANTGFGGDEYRGVSTPAPPLPSYPRSGSVNGPPMRPRFGSQSTLSTQRSFTPGPPRYDTPGPFRDGTPGPIRSGTPGPIPRNGTPGPQWSGPPGPPRNQSPAPPMPYTNTIPMPNAPNQDPDVATPNTMAGFDFGIIPQTSRQDLPSVDPQQPTRPVYQSLKLQPVTTWQKAYNDTLSSTPPTHGSTRDERPTPVQFQPFSPASGRDATPHSLPPPESYEMKQQPAHASPAQVATPSSYVAFKPTSQTPTISPPTVHIGEPSPRRSISPLSTTSDPPNDYFGKVRVVSSLNPPVATEHRLTVLGYGDILDDYGADHVSTPGSHPRSAAPSPLPGQEPTSHR